MKMETLRKITEDAGFTNVRTYIQSGNLLFDSEDKDVKQLILKLEEMILKSFGFKVDVIVRKLADIESIVNSSQFSSLKSDEEKKYYITFLRNDFTEQLQIPFFFM